MPVYLDRHHIEGVTAEGVAAAHQLEGFTRIRLRVELDADASAEQREKLLALTERYYVVLQTLKRGTQVTLA